MLFAMFAGDYRSRYKLKLIVSQSACLFKLPPGCSFFKYRKLFLHRKTPCHKAFGKELISVNKRQLLSFAGFDFVTTKVFLRLSVSHVLSLDRVVFAQRQITLAFISTILRIDSSIVSPVLA